MGGSMIHVRREAFIPGNGRILFDREGESIVWWIRKDLITDDGAKLLEAALNIVAIQYTRLPVLAG
ncbi:hypothetical protein ACIBSV_47175 [Embleya sp. NPDC050154]|uniref:hypothetical protein n=1 Tax=Embleya sp. NPDC050154 TaxID=3363988 RepID=UPI0037AC18CB